MNAQEEMFGEDRLKKLVLAVGQQDLRARQIVETIKNESMSFSGPEQQHDDLTIVVIKAI